jgi:hypothetical protein
MKKINEIIEKDENFKIKIEELEHKIKGKKWVFHIFNKYYYYFYKYS